MPSSAENPAFELMRGTTPLLVSVPHDGRQVPEAIEQRLTAEARRLPDTDWHVRTLYDFAHALGATTLFATQSRYVVDVNRDPSGADLYPGASNTEICPISTFDFEPVYCDGMQPSAAEIGERIERWFSPYHACLEAELAELRERHGVAVLFDAHSIRSRVPRFFEGTLPDLNLGTAGGASAGAELAERVHRVLRDAQGFSSVRDGRFRGGYVTRHYGRPERGVHALQLELAQHTYMDEAYPFTYRPERAAVLRGVLRQVIEAILAWARG
jgi:N-formylglutamate deformylase